MKPKIRILVSDDGELLVVISAEMTDGEAAKFDREMSLKIAHQIIAGQTKGLPSPLPY